MASAATRQGSPVRSVPGLPIHLGLLAVGPGRGPVTGGGLAVAAGRSTVPARLEPIPLGAAAVGIVVRSSALRGHGALHGPQVALRRRLVPPPGRLVAVSGGLVPPPGCLVPPPGRLVALGRGRVPLPGRLVRALRERGGMLGTGPLGLPGQGIRRGPRRTLPLLLGAGLRCRGLALQSPRIPEAALAAGPSGHVEEGGRDVALRRGHLTGDLAHPLTVVADV